MSQAVSHVKACVSDNDVLLTGANLSDDYFTNRQDRYLLLRVRGSAATLLLYVGMQSRVEGVLWERIQSTSSWDSLNSIMGCLLLPGSPRSPIPHLLSSLRLLCHLFPLSSLLCRMRVGCRPSITTWWILWGASPSQSTCPGPCPLLALFETSAGTCSRVRGTTRP